MLFHLEVQSLTKREQQKGNNRKKDGKAAYLFWIATG